MKQTKHQQWLKKLKLKEIKVHMGMFDYGINVVIGDYSGLEEYTRFKLDDDEFELAIFDKDYLPRGKCLYRGGYRPIIWIPRKPQTPREHATLAHESLHAMYHVARWAGFPLDDSTEEVMTHGMAHIINQILSAKWKPEQTYSHISNNG